MKVKRKCSGKLVKKIQERCLLNYSLIRNASCLSPNNVISQKVLSVSNFKKLCDKLFQFKCISGTISDNAKLEFDAFLSNDVMRNRDKFESFKFKRNRLDCLLKLFLHNDNNYKYLWKIWIFMFALLHGRLMLSEDFTSISRHRLITFSNYH